MRRYAATILLAMTIFVALALLTPSQSGSAQNSGPASSRSPVLAMVPASVSSAGASSQNLAGLEQSVTVLRDTWGIPHIYAENQHDMFFAQGFVTAQDRLFQMELWKRAGHAERGQFSRRVRQRKLGE